MEDSWKRLNHGTQYITEAIKADAKVLFIQVIENVPTKILLQ
jgi:hypothetical protein